MAQLAFQRIKLPSNGSLDILDIALAGGLVKGIAHATHPQQASLRTEYPAWVFPHRLHAPEGRTGCCLVVAGIQLAVNVRCHRKYMQKVLKNLYERYLEIELSTWETVRSLSFSLIWPSSCHISFVLVHTPLLSLPSFPSYILLTRRRLPLSPASPSHSFLSSPFLSSLFFPSLAHISLYSFLPHLEPLHNLQQTNKANAYRKTATKKEPQEPR